MDNRVLEPVSFIRALAFNTANPDLSRYRQSVERLLSDLRCLSTESDDAIAQHLGVVIPRHSLTELEAMTTEEKRRLTTELHLLSARLRYAHYYYRFYGRWPIFDGRPLPNYDLIGVVGI